MVLTKEQQQGQDLMQSLINKAWDSATFKEQLINNPKKTIEEALNTGKPISSETNIVVEDQTDENTIYLNIPKQVNFDSFELSDEEMEMVAGGIVGGTLGIMAAGAGLIAFGAWIYDVTHD